MHIKQVITSGFRSFRSQSEIEPFSSRHNVIVGRNGSGKSNFFDAIQFVLATSRFNTLRQEERQHLLHEGAGANVMAAFVEIVFDNSDGRMAVDGDEVVLRRTIGLKKDEFFLNRKRVTKSEVTSLLESAGFSKSNPYYIVQQGKVNALCLSKDAERLELLKEVAGTRVYEERREESNAIINESNSKRDKIQEVISYIEERLAELEGEKEELGAYQRCDREKRALEYTMYDQELRRAREQIDSIEAQRSDDASLVHGLHEKIRETQDEIEEQKRILEKAESNNEKIARDRDSAERDRSRLVSQRAKLEVDVKEAEERVSSDAELQQSLEEQANKLDAAIVEARRELESTVQPKFETAKEQAAQAVAKQSQVDLQINELLAKQGRGQRFTSASDRDSFLTEQLAGLERSIESKREGVDKLEQRVNDGNKELSSIKKAIKAKENEMKKMQTELAKMSNDISEKTEKKHELAENRKMQWQRKQQVDDEVKKYSDELNGFQQDFRASMPKHIAQGLEALEKIVREEKISGYYGPLVENFELTHTKYRVPVEVAAGNGLFHVVVEDDEVASRLIARLSKENLGRVTFMPLKQLSVQELNYPQSSEVHPLMKLALKFKPQMQKAMQQVFGKKLIARDFDTARQFARECNMDALTMDGDEVNRKGALEGGFHDERRSKLKAYLGIVEAKTKLDDAIKRQAKEQSSSLEVDTSVAKVMGEIQREEAKRANLKMLSSQTALELKQAQQDLTVLEERLQKDQSERLPAMIVELGALQAQADSYRNEIGTALQQSLSSKDAKLLSSLKSTASDLAAATEAATAEFEEASVERQRLQSLLKDNLLLQRKEIQEKLSSAGGDGLGGDVDVGERALLFDQKKKELNLVSKDAESAAETIRTLDKAALDLKETIRKTKKILDELKNKETHDAEELANAERQTEKQLNKRSMLVQKRDDSLRKIQQLGSLPAAELDEYARDSAKELMKKLKKVNHELNKYSHVNKKALDQYVNFSEQRENLLERKKELDKGALAIEELIAALDRQKEEAILRTFKGVSKHFAEVFSELVPQGKGQLIMRTSADAGDDDDDDDEDTQASKASSSSNSGPRVHEFEGVQVRVSFTPAGEVYLMSQLSGGQKALVALSMIFAIQRCDPAPFYLFDELDQALDSTYRAAVAAMIQRQANAEGSRTQFITTTFRPELVKVASKCYGISLQNKNSNIHALTKGDALNFVADLMNEEEAVGQNSAAPLPRDKKRLQAEQPLADEENEDGSAENGEEEEEEDEEEEQEEEEEEEEEAPKKTPKRKSRR